MCPFMFLGLITQPVLTIWDDRWGPILHQALPIPWKLFILSVGLYGPQEAVEISPLATLTPLFQY